MSTKEELLNDLALVDREIEALWQKMQEKIAIRGDIKKELAQHDTRA